MSDKGMTPVQIVDGLINHQADKRQMIEGMMAKARSIIAARRRWALFAAATPRSRTNGIFLSSLHVTHPLIAMRTRWLQRGRWQRMRRQKFYFRPAR